MSKELKNKGQIVKYWRLKAEKDKPMYTPRALQRKRVEKFFVLMQKR